MKWKIVLNALNFVAIMAYAFNMTKCAMVSIQKAIERINSLLNHWNLHFFSSKKFTGLNQCGDFFDEEHCTFLCKKGEYFCHPTLCLKPEELCDGVIQCYNAYDEEGCLNVTTSTKPSSNRETPYQMQKNATKTHQCGPHEFQCNNWSECIPLAARCDSYQDCFDRLKIAIYNIFFLIIDINLNKITSIAILDLGVTKWIVHQSNREPIILHLVILDVHIRIEFVLSMAIVFVLINSAMEKQTVRMVSWVVDFPVESVHVYVRQFFYLNSI